MLFTKLVNEHNVNLINTKIRSVYKQAHDHSVKYIFTNIT